MVASLSVLQEWANVHESILERYESKRFYAFHLFTGSQYYANVLTQMVGIVISQPQLQDM